MQVFLFIVNEILSMVNSRFDIRKIQLQTFFYIGKITDLIRLTYFIFHDSDDSLFNLHSSNFVMIINFSVTWSSWFHLKYFAAIWSFEKQCFKKIISIFWLQKGKLIIFLALAKLWNFVQYESYSIFVITHVMKSSCREIFVDKYSALDYSLLKSSVY